MRRRPSKHNSPSTDTAENQAAKRTQTTTTRKFRTLELKTREEEEKIERMFETWVRTMDHYRVLKKLAGITRNDTRLTQARAELARVQHALLALAKNGRGLGTLRILYEKNLNAALQAFVDHLHRLMKDWNTATTSFSEITKDISPVTLGTWQRAFRIRPASLLAILHSETVLDARKDGAKAGALQAAAMVMHVDPMTVRRRIQSVPKDAWFVVDLIRLPAPLDKLATKMK